MPQILVVEDTRELLENMLDLLEISGFQAEGALNGAEAQQQIQTDPPAVVLTDIKMPVMDGFELIKWLKSDANTVNIPVIVMSGNTMKELVAHAMELGADAFILKPFRIEHMTEVVETYIKPNLPPM